MLWNPGQLPERWTQEQLLAKHPSHPFNPLLASAFFRAGYVESWGRGLRKSLVSTVRTVLAHRCSISVCPA
ncbi:MAG: ATP-binding protein [Pseudomonas protegens]